MNVSHETGQERRRMDSRSTCSHWQRESIKGDFRMSFSERKMTIKSTLECVLFEKFAFYSESNGIALMHGASI